jgi:hypothetical protein
LAIEKGTGMPTAIMESLRDAILLNNTGVHHLDCGNVDGALYSFQCAVVAVKVAIAMSTDPSVCTALMDQPPTTTTTTTAPRFPPKPHSHNAGYHDEVSSSSIYQASKSSAATASTTYTNVLPAVSVLPQEQRSSSALLDGLNVGISYIYNRPLLIPTDISIQSMEHMNSVVVTASTYIIFNFALTCHLVGKHTGKDSYFIRAMRLYELTLKVLETAQSNSSTPCVHEMHSVLECLALNNLAQMHYELCDYRSSQFYMDSMYALLITIKRMDTYLEENELEEIMLNLVYLQSPSVAKAA